MKCNQEKHTEEIVLHVIVQLYMQISTKRLLNEQATKIPRKKKFVAHTRSVACIQLAFMMQFSFGQCIANMYTKTVSKIKLNVEINENTRNAIFVQINARN